jgi:hypothetical protein
MKKIGLIVLFVLLAGFGRMVWLNVRGSSKGTISMRIAGVAVA